MIIVMETIKNKFNSAVIFAASKGRRMGGCSKGMVSFCGKPLISIGIDALLAYGIADIYILYREDDEDIHHIYDYYPNQDNIYLIRDTYLKGPVQAHLSLTENIKYPMLTMDCDLIFSKDEFHKMLHQGSEKLESNEAVVAIINDPVEDEEYSFYIASDETVHFANTQIKENLQCGGYIYGWKKPIHKDVLAYNGLNAGDYRNFFDYFTNNKKVGFMTINHLWDVDTPEKLVKSELAIKNPANF